MSKNQVFQKTMRKSELSLRRYSPIALSCIASIGVIVTAVAAVKATPKAVELIKADIREKHSGDAYAYTKKEAITTAWKCYIPAAAFGISTIACIIGANALNRHQQAMLTSAYALIQNSYREYKDKLKELYGEETHNAVVDAIVKEKCEDVCISAPGGFYNSTLDFGESTEPEITRTFYDSFSQRYFETTIANVIEAEYHLNRNYMLGGDVTLNDFYELLGLEKTDMGSTLGWSSYTGDILWLDFNHRLTTLDDGMEIFIIEMVFEPTADCMENF